MAGRALPFAAPNREETLWGFGYLILSMAFLPSLLDMLNGIASLGMSRTQMNFLYYLINFTGVIFIFRQFLAVSFRHTLRHPVIALEGLVLGLAAHYAFTAAVMLLIRWIAPGFANVNDANIVSLSRNGRFLMVIGTILLAPPAEECFYRGLVFRKLYDRSPIAGFLVSAVVFSAIHVVGYIGKAAPLTLILCFLQYLPAGLSLAWGYEKGQSIAVPIAMHMLINARSVQALF